jgi:hypothetical protein
MKNALRNSKSIPVMLGVNALTALYTAIVFIPAPYGERVRPMGWASMIFMIAAASFCLGAFLSSTDAMRGKSKWAVCGFVLSITPFPLAILMFKMFVTLKGLQVAD